jgi:hypothetical protein
LLDKHLSSSEKNEKSIFSVYAEMYPKNYLVFAVFVLCFVSFPIKIKVIKLVFSYISILTIVSSNQLLIKLSNKFNTWYLGKKSLVNSKKNIKQHLQVDLGKFAKSVKGVSNELDSLKCVFCT